MPVDFLTEAERERWQRLPDTMPQDDLFVFFLLSDDDRRETQRQRDPQNRLGYALQLCILRYLGFVPDARLSHKNFTRLSNASNLLGQSAKSSSAS